MKERGLKTVHFGVYDGPFIQSIIHIALQLQSTLDTTGVHLKISSSEA